MVNNIIVYLLLICIAISCLLCNSFNVKPQSSHKISILTHRMRPKKILSTLSMRNHGNINEINSQSNKFASTIITIALGCVISSPFQSVAVDIKAAAVSTNIKQKVKEIEPAQKFGEELAIEGALSNNEAAKVKLTELAKDIVSYKAKSSSLKSELLKLNGLIERLEKKASSKNIDNDKILLPHFENDLSNVWHLYVVRVENRSSFIDKLKSFGIEAGIHYPTPPHLQGAYKDKSYYSGQFPISELLHTQVVSLPIFPFMPLELQRYLTETLNGLKSW